MYVVVGVVGLLGLLLLLATAMTGAVSPIPALASLSALVVVAAIFVPCVLLFAVLWLHQGLGRALRKEGFEVTWLSAQPAAQPFEEGRWPLA